MSDAVRRPLKPKDNPLCRTTCVEQLYQLQSALANHDTGTLPVLRLTMRVNTCYTTLALNQPSLSSSYPSHFILST